ncbi:MAG TPA: hypothetical protein VE129_12680, partial [Thermoanaerobaculia bacterium]|nr:hypothetical protein [Thermoanaerobaculia bacterium]
MIRAPKSIVATVLGSVFAGLVVVAAPARAEAPAGIAISGSVKKPHSVDVAALDTFPRHATLAKVPGAERYRGTFEVEGVALKDLLDRAEIAKATDDGFDRPLDLAVVVTGRDGKKALFSWGELFLGDDAGAALLVDRIRPLVPHHHDAIEDRRF